MTYSWLLQVTDLKQYGYCPRIPFYRYCLPKIRPVTAKMEEGITAHQEAEEREQRRSLRTYGLTTGERRFNVALQSETMGLSGSIDLVIETPEEIIPIDYKVTERKPSPWWRLQLAAYGLLLEEATCRPVRRGFLYQTLLRKAHEVRLTPAVKAETLTTLAAIREQIATERMPAPTEQRVRCLDCEFRRFCNDV